MHPKVFVQSWRDQRLSLSTGIESFFPFEYQIHKHIFTDTETIASEACMICIISEVSQKLRENEIESVFSVLSVSLIYSCFTFHWS